LKIMAVICEYNPFHKGHEYQLKTHKSHLLADGVICLMSGSFVQRGAPAMFDKWSRAKAAILSGADLVLELPVVYSSQSAMRFSYGAVSLLDTFGCVDVLSFGSECGNLSTLIEAAEVLSLDAFRDCVVSEMKSGISYPAARERAFIQHAPHLSSSLVTTPNNILALEYINALRKRNSKIKPATLLRNKDFISASEIRADMEKNLDVSHALPQSVHTLFQSPYNRAAFDQIVSYHFLRETPETLRCIADVKEGLENRFISCAKTCFGAEALSDSVKTKRYTKTRIDRIIINALLGITDRDTELAPQYARVLAFNDRGTEILKKMNDTSSVPIITKVANAASENADFCRMLEKDILATDIYAQLTVDKRSGLDFTTSPVYVK